MTVGIAALADRRRAIVVMADKLFTLGGGELQAEEQSPKAIKMSHGWIAMYAGDGTFAEAVVAGADTTRQMMSKKARPEYQIGMMKLVHDQFRVEFWDAIKRNVLSSQLIDPDVWVNRRSSLDEWTRHWTAKQIEDYEGDCELLLCGFTPVEEATIISIGRTEQQHERTYAAIGTGYRLALSQLASRNPLPTDSIARVLYDAYEAKAHAELNAFVGKKTFDAFVMIANGYDIPMSAEVKTLLREMYLYRHQMPFSHRPGEVPAPKPSPKWQQELQDEIEKCLKPYMQSVLAKRRALRPKRKRTYKRK